MQIASSTKQSYDAIGAESRSGEVGSLIRLNLGCGTKRWDGYVNVDLADNWTGALPDVSADLRALPFPNDYADEAHAIHVIEHFPRGETSALLREWWRVLKPGGKLFVECPCLDKIARLLVAQPLDEETRYRYTMNGLYGEYWRGPGMQHFWCFSAVELRSLMLYAGFVDLELMEPVFHIAMRDMRVVGVK